MRQTATQRIVQYGELLRNERLPSAIEDLAKIHLLDALGVGLAACSLKTRPRIEQAVAIMGNAREATVLGQNAPMSAPAAALLNGSLIHALEFDDTHMKAVVHASAVVAATALAVAEREGSSGQSLLKAFVLGWELLARAGLSSPQGFHARGFQGTPVMGAPVAAAVTAWLMTPQAEIMQQAMGIAGSQSSGIFEFVQDGSNVKMLHGGWPAHAGILAAALAQAGLSGPATVFEGKKGLFRAFTDDAGAGQRFIDALGDLGQRWLIEDVAFKAYPCCHYIQGAIEALQRILSKGVTASDIERIDCQLPREVAWLVCAPWQEKIAPPSGHVAKFSLPYCLAALVVVGRVDVRTFDRENPDPRFQATMQSIHFQAMETSDFPKRYSAKIQVRSRSGQVFEESVLDVHGSPERPFSRGEVLDKFRANAEMTMSHSNAQDIIDCIERLDEANAITDLSRALRRANRDFRDEG